MAGWAIAIDSNAAAQAATGRRRGHPDAFDMFLSLMFLSSPLMPANAGIQNPFLFLGPRFPPSR
jgi:hypothetical protein